MWIHSPPMARRTANGLAYAVDTQAAELGVSIEATGASRLTAFRLKFPGSAGQAADVYVRGRDVIASYPPRTGWPVRTEVYWRSIDSTTDCAGGIDLVVSVETGLLHVDPRIRCESEMDEPTAVRRADGNWATAADAELTPPAWQPTVLRRLSDELSYLEMVYPSDFFRAELRGGTVCWTLFGESLEKGVIRRARLRGLFLTGDQPQLEAARQFEEFCASELPLTV